MNIFFGVIFSLIGLGGLWAGAYIAINDYTGNGITRPGRASVFAFVEFGLAALCIALAAAFFGAR